MLHLPDFEGAPHIVCSCKRCYQFLVSVIMCLTYSNLVNLSGGGATAAAAAGADDTLYATTQEKDEEKLPSSSSHLMPRPPPRTHRPQSSYGKYHEDNLKNINVEKKTQV